MNEEKDAKDERNENMRRSYVFRNQGLEIKINTMSLLYKQVELLAEKAQSCTGDEYYQIVEIMAQLGQAIIPD